MTTLKPKQAAAVRQFAQQLTHFPVTKLHTDYDEGADVLYINFGSPQRATDSDMRDDGIIVRRNGKEIIGLTILDASQRGETNPVSGDGKHANRRSKKRS